MEMGKKVLIIDDDEALVRLIDQVLTQKGYEVLKASDGQEALRLLFDQRPDLVILDVVMPRMDGGQRYDALSFPLQRMRRERLPIVMASLP